MEHWKRSGGEEGIPPISEALDRDIYYTQVGKALGLPATEVEYIPEYWFGVVKVLWAWEERERKASARKSSRKGRSTSSEPRRIGPRGS